MALAVGGSGLIACLLVWFFIATRSPSLGWIGLLGLIGGWVAGLFWFIRR